MQRPRILVFDLGGVLLDFAPQRRLAAIAAACRTDEESVRSLLAGPLVRDLDVGLATLGNLARDLGRLAEGRIDEAEAARLWLSAFSPNRELFDIAALLARDYRLAGFSNNPPFIRQALPPGVSLDPLVLSAEIGVLKPDPASFAAAEDVLQASPGEILFIDDAYRNVTAARSRGWTALHYRSPERLLADLRRNILA